jgi:hypothetical protein
VRILITNEHLDRRAGSDLFVRDLARGLAQRGHFVFTYGSDLRERPRLFQRDTISVATDLEDLPFRPDIIHARHHLDAMTAVMGLPGVPAIHHCLGPPLPVVLPIHPRIYRYVAPSANVASWITNGSGIPAESVSVLHNAVDILRFARVRNPRLRPKRVLVYDDLLLPGAAVVKEIERAAADIDLTVDLIGRRLGRVVDSPEAILPDYDIVCAMGRKAIEAIACGCAVVVLAPGNCGEMLDGLNFERLRDADFSADVHAPPAADRIRREFDRYSGDSCIALSARMRSIADFSTYTSHIESIYLSSIRRHEEYVEQLSTEQQAVSDYLLNLSRMLKDVDQTEKTMRDIPLPTASTLLDVSAKLAHIQAELDEPQW